MERFSRDRQVFFFEEYIPTDHHLPYLEFHRFEGSAVVAVRPRVPVLWDEAERTAALAKLVDSLLALHRVERPILWFYTPAMYHFSKHVDAAAVVYDCMDELANFRFAPPDLQVLESDLLRDADVVFTGGHSLFEAKRHLHDNIHPFPSSVDAAHFAAARSLHADPADQALIKGQRLGFYGVIDERIDLQLLREVAKARPNWSLVMVGPVVKIEARDLPKAPNIHYLGQKDYSELPAYLSGWNAAIMPFAINDATRFISPTKTPEFLAAGRPVVSTGIGDVIQHYGHVKGVRIARTTAEFISACEDALALDAGAWLPEVDSLLARQSWDRTHEAMSALLSEAIERNAGEERAPTPRPALRRANGQRRYDYLIVGAGFAGSVLAERLAADANKRVLVVDRRNHVAGNAYDHFDAAGVMVHRYGPHIFHTNSAEVVSYLSRFTTWRPYEHRVLADIGDGRRLPIPINRTTLNGLYGLSLDDDLQAAQFLSSRAEPVAEIRTSRDVVISQVGTDLYQTFFEGYTRKQWGLDPSELDKSVTARVPTRVTTDDRYFLDAHQAMPAHGYTRMFEAMLDHPNIELALGTDYADLRGLQLAPHTVFTGPIDEFFDHRFGHLPYRSLEFRHETLEQRRFQPVGVVNYPDEAVPYTRITEYKHLTGQVHPSTSISYEFSRSEGDPYYPIPRPENQALFKRYEALASERSDVTFLGRLGSYRYYNMDQVVGQALSVYRRMTAAGAQEVESQKSLVGA